MLEAVIDLSATGALCQEEVKLPSSGSRSYGVASSHACFQVIQAVTF